MAEIGIINEVGEFSQFVPLNEQDQKTYDDAEKRRNKGNDTDDKKNK